MSNAMNIINKTMHNSIFVVFVIFSLTMFIAFCLPIISSATAVTGFNAGNIISDSVFTNSNSMDANQIQAFLNSKVPSCDTNGTQPATEFGRSDITHSQYATSRGWPSPPYPCLKDYTENGLSSAQIIYNVATQHQINPQVLIVLLQKEQGLVTDTWPLPVQYRSATGYGCPDTAPCDSQYYGLTNQLQWSAHMFRSIMDNSSTWYTPYVLGNTYILWSPNTSCGGSTVNIQNRATQSLYNYTPYQPNQASLDAGYGTGDSCSSHGNRNFYLYFSDWFGSTQYTETILRYQSQLSNLGWTIYTINSGTTGTTGQNRPMESFRIDGNIEYSSYSYTTGWQPTVSNGMVSGTIGYNRSIQAIKINPTGSLADKYDIYYRAHVSSIGWMGWTKNSQPAGVTGDNSKDIEAFEIRLVAKGSSISGSTDNAYQNINTITYNPSLSLDVTAHIGDVGWQPTVTNDMVSGIIAESKRIEALKISLNNNTGLSGYITYSAHVANIGWQGFMSNGNMAGTTGQSKQMEAVRIALTGVLGDNYDIWYRGHVQYIGWVNWAKNGQPTGSIGAGLQLEAIETRIVPKDSISLNQQNNLYNPTNQSMPSSYTLNCTAHVSNVGWIRNVQQDNTCGTTGQSKPLEAIKFSNITSIFGDISISCSAYIKGSDWMTDILPENVCGTTGQSKPLQAIKLKITGSAADKYDIYYKIHLSKQGWQDWVSNNTLSGTPISGNNVEAINVKLVQK